MFGTKIPKDILSFYRLTEWWWTPVYMDIQKAISNAQITRR